MANYLYENSVQPSHTVIKRKLNMIIYTFEYFHNNVWQKKKKGEILWPT